MPEITYSLSELGRLRRWRGLSQSGLSQLSGVPTTTIQKHERGAYADAALSVALPLAEALRVPVEALCSAEVSSKLLQQQEAQPA